jgi:hypothetical protein
MAGELSWMGGWDCGKIFVVMLARVKPESEQASGALRGKSLEAI